jgi:hypothetical protein
MPRGAVTRRMFPDWSFVANGIANEPYRGCVKAKKSVLG